MSTFRNSKVEPMERIGDDAVVPLDVSGFETLDLNQKMAAYHFSRAAVAGDRITFDQRNRFHLPMLFLLEDVVQARPSLLGDTLDRLTFFLKQMWLYRGNHHPYSTVKVLPPFTESELRKAVQAADSSGARLAIPKGVGLNEHLTALAPAFFDPDFHHQLTVKSPPPGKDVVSASACNLYDDSIREDEVQRFESRHCLNSRLARKGGQIVEEVYRAGGDGVSPGLYAAPLQEVVEQLELALPHLPEEEASYFRHLVRYFKTGEPAAFRDYNRGWIRSRTQIDIIIGFIEQYLDPMGHRGEFEATVHMPDRVRGNMMDTLAQNAAYFETRMPWNPRYCRSHIEVAEVQIVNMLMLGGATSPMAYSGVNLPNETQLREEHGSKSLLINNVVRQRLELQGERYMREFSPDESALDRARSYSREAWDLFVALHEVIGHASGKVSSDLVGEPEDHLLEYASTLEEARADLVALWLFPDPRLRDLGLVRSSEVVTEAYWSLLRSAMATIGRLEGPDAEEDHDRAELLIVNYLRQETEAIGEFRRFGKTYWVVKDLEAAHKGVGELLSRLMTIKAHGDYAGARKLVERYAVHVHPEFHRELRSRIKSLEMPERIGFMCPDYTPVRDEADRIVDVEARFAPDFLTQQLGVSKGWRGEGRV